MVFYITLSSKEFNVIYITFFSKPTQPRLISVVFVKVKPLNKTRTLKKRSQENSFVFIKKKKKQQQKREISLS